MTKVIEEILNIINYKYKDYYVQDIVSGDDLKLLSDYITSLQKENERLKEENSNLIAKNKRKLNKYVKFPMSRYRGTDKIREKIKCPQLGSIHYGEWGALPLEVRYTLYDLCELLESREEELELVRCDLHNAYSAENGYQEEIERLNNIIDQLEDLLKQPWNIDCINQNNYFLDKLKELKEGK